jgi:Tfp pilus assembly protein PilO
MIALSRRERILVAMAVAAAILIGGYLYVLEPLREQRQQAGELVPVREARLERRQTLIAQRPALQRELETTTKRLEAETARLLQGPTPPLAASELQKLVKDLAAGVGVEVRSERILPAVDKGGLQEVPIEITVAGGIRESVNLLSQMERTPKLLTIQDLKLRVISVGQPKDLLTTVTVSGYLLGAAPPARPADKPEPARPGPSRATTPG